MNIEQVEKPSERLHEITRLMCADNNLELKPLEQWSNGDIGFCYSNLNEQASLLHKDDFVTFTTGETGEVSVLATDHDLHILSSFLEEVFDGHLSSEFLINDSWK